VVFDDGTYSAQNLRLDLAYPPRQRWVFDAGAYNGFFWLFTSCKPDRGYKSGAGRLQHQAPTSDEVGMQEGGRERLVCVGCNIKHPPLTRWVCRKAGLPVGNQSVLLAGVNDCVHIQRALVHRLVENRIRPYYLYQCDLVAGSGHFRTPVGKGLEIMEGLRGHTSGYAIPTFVIDAPGGGGKIPVMPNYLISYSDHKVVLRNYEGYITTYEEPETYTRHDSAACRYCQHERPEPGQSGVLGLLEGERMWIEPKGFEDIHTRGNLERHRLQDPAKWVPFGVGAIEGRASAPLKVLEGGPVHDTPPQYAPGEEPRPREGEPTGSAHGEML
jgi:hypothetical protein